MKSQMINTVKSTNLYASLLFCALTSRNVQSANLNMTHGTLVDRRGCEHQSKEGFTSIHCNYSCVFNTCHTVLGDMPNVYQKLVCITR